MSLKVITDIILISVKTIFLVVRINSFHCLLYSIFNSSHIFILTNFNFDFIIQWAHLCKSFLQESKWSYNKYTPTFEEYLENAWRSSSGGLSLVHSYFLLGRSINKKALESLEKYHNLIRWPSTIFRLSNDLATSKVLFESIIFKDINKFYQLTGSSNFINNINATHRLNGREAKLPV